MGTFTMLIVTILVIILYKVFNLLLQHRNFLKKIEHIKGPKGLPLVGNALVFKGPEDLLPNLMKYYHDYGSTFKLQLGPDSYIFTGDPNIIEGITSSNTEVNKSITYKFVKNWLGEGLLAADNPRWKIHRRLITPAFHFNILKDFMPIFHKHSTHLVEHWKQQINSSGKIEKDVNFDIHACALDTICETAMGISVNALNDGIKSKYMDSVRNLGRMVMERTFSFWKQFDMLYKFSKSYQKEVAMLEIIHNTTKEVIKQKQADIAKMKQYNVNVTNKLNQVDEVGAKKRVAFLDLLLATTTDNGNNFTDLELREEVDTFVFTGHDTTATAISYVLYFLAKHPEVQQKVYNEIKEVLQGDSQISYEKLSSLKYMDMVIKETLRICPIAPIFFRQLSEDVNYNGVKLPKGLIIAIFAYAAHRNEKIFENPEEFNPERFTVENCSNRHPYAYIPFSAGPRNCVGQRFAMVEMKCMITNLIQNLKFSKSPHFEVKPCCDGILKSLNGVQLIVEARN